MSDRVHWHATGPASRHIVDDSHLVTPGEQGIGEMRADKTGTAGDEHAHGRAVYARGCGRWPPRRRRPELASRSGPLNESEACSRQVAGSFQGTRWVSTSSP